MKKQLLSVFFFLGLTSALYAQDAIYTANGNRLSNAQLTDVNEDRVTFTVQQGDKSSTYNFQRQNVLVAFRKGNFLIINGLSSNTIQAKQELQTFLTTTAWQEKDYLLRAVPFSVIPAKISYENDAIINYVTNNGKSASISKGELIAVFYNDGRHSLVKDASEAVPLLTDLKKPIEVSVKSSSSQQIAKSTVPPSRNQVETPASIKQSPPSNDQSLETGRQTKDVSPPEPGANKLVLSDSDYQSYRRKALDKVDEFSSYLNVITNKSLSSYQRNQAVDQAASLFMPAATIEVTSSKQPGARRYPIRTYLNNLKLLPYRSTKIEWTEVQYFKELSQAADGNYYGIITGQQTFVGYGATANYTDITQKNVRVKLERYVKTEGGHDDVKWGLLLGSIGVSAQ